jgi:two-component system phosphate regulon sensor histidine kinase PhoR
MGEVRRRALPLPPEKDGPRLIPLEAGAVAVQRGDRIAVLESAAARDLLGPLALLPGAPSPEARTDLVVEKGGAGPLAGVRFLARAGRSEVDGAVRDQALLLLGAVGIAAGVSLAALVFLLRGARRDAELARLKTEFVANVSHELRTPLSVVRLYAETLRNGRAPEGEEDDYLAVLERESASLSRLVDRVLDFARIERGEKEYRLAPGDLAAAVREIAREAEARHTGLALRAEVPPEPVRARFDADALAGAVGNLLENAAKHGGGGEVTLALVENGRVARIEVRDRGPGVPPHEAERVFERFHRGRAAVAGAVRGSGLGLTLAKHAAEGHGGRAGHRPREGGGAVFFLEIPTEGEK